MAASGGALARSEPCERIEANSFVCGFLAVRVSAPIDDSRVDGAGQAQPRAKCHVSPEVTHW